MKRIVVFSCSDVAESTVEPAMAALKDVPTQRRGKLPSSWVIELEWEMDDNDGGGEK